MADINYWGLTGTKRSVTGITLATATVDTLITAIATDEGLPADYYHWSLLSDPSKNSITYGDSSTKLSTIGLVDGDTVSCTPQQNESKQERQIRKLTIAEAKRKAFGDVTKPYYRVNNTYDLTLLPDTYATAADDNANSGGGGTITNITIATPLTRLDGSNYATPGNVTIQFATPAAGGGLGTDKATGTPNIVAGKLAGITIVYGGTGYAKGITGLVSCDIFIIDSTPGNPDTREIRDGLPSGVDVTASDITPAALLNGRPWTT